MTIKLAHEGPISRVIMDNPPMNLMTIEFMDELVALHREADAHPKTRVIITESAIPGMFSNGLDPGYVLKTPESERAHIFRGVGRMLHGLFALKKPHICRISGPAMAGGAVLAITADFRYFEAEHGRMSFSEPKVGLPIPQAISSVIAHFCHPTHLRDVVMFAANMDAQTALEYGIADGVATGAAYDEMIAKQAERLSRLSPTVMRTTKQGLRCEILPKAEQLAIGDPAFETFTRNQFLGEGLSALVEGRFPNFEA
jgi:enoyl-CoA hydratase/carnithine racemase